MPNLAANKAIKVKIIAPTGEANVTFHPKNANKGGTRCLMTCSVPQRNNVSRPNCLKMVIELSSCAKKMLNQIKLMAPSTRMMGLLPEIGLRANAKRSTPISKVPA